MGERSNIEWCDATWNPVRGCVKVSPGCKHCYAETFAERFRGVQGHPYEQGFDLRLVPKKLTEPMKWKEPKRIFVNSMSDLFQDGVSDEFIDQAFAVMALCSQHTFQVLTKRAERMGDYMRRRVGPGISRSTLSHALSKLPYDLPPRKTGYQIPYDWPLPNVWLGVSVENQRYADERIPLLLETPAAVRFISAEPLLDEVDLSGYLDCGYESGGPAGWVSLPSLDLVIIGGESGPGARPFDLAWARKIIQQRNRFGKRCAIFMKQLGVQPVSAATPMITVTKKGGEMAEWPEDLRIREFPFVEATS